MQFNKYYSQLTQSSIRAISKHCQNVNGINLGQGVCDMPTPEPIKQAAYQAIAENKNTYVSAYGITPLREGIANKARTFNNIDCDVDNVLVTHGATGAFIAASRALFNPGDEIILFEPYYAYHKLAIDSASLRIKTVSINLDDFSIDLQAVRDAVTDKTKAILICTPCNPCGKVFSRSELLGLGELACEKNLYLITDEMYEYITYPGVEHISVASLSPDIAARTITMSGFSKTYNMTGWRLGYAVAPKDIIERMQLAHDLIYVCAATPLQYAAITAINMPQNYYDSLRENYTRKREIFFNGLKKLGLTAIKPDGAYYTLVDISNTEYFNTDDPALSLLNASRVAAVDGRSFYLQSDENIKGKEQIRFCFATNEDRLKVALEYLGEAL